MVGVNTSRSKPPEVGTRSKCQGWSLLAQWCSDMDFDCILARGTPFSLSSSSGAKVLHPISTLQVDACHPIKLNFPVAVLTLRKRWGNQTRCSTILVVDRNATNKTTEKTAANNSTPLPANLHDASATFQSWHEFNASVDQWTSVPVTETYSDRDSRERKQRQRPIQGSKFVLVTWNVDSSSTLPATRISAIISHVASSAPAVDVIFFQEVSRQAFHSLLCDAQVRQYWYSSEADETNWHGQSFASMTLLSKRRFNHANGSLGPVWRYKYPSRFGRDALCCDVFLPSSAQSPNSEADVVRARLVNVHLDSLPIQPSQRPRQLSVIASVLRSASRGLVAGDFNPVLTEDATLISENHLIDAWHELHPDEPGFTWGVDGKQPFPPGRLDKVALVGLRPYHIEVMHPDNIDLGSDDGNRNASIKDAVNVCDETGLVKPSDQIVPWSDHSGLKCCVGLAGE